MVIHCNAGVTRTRMVGDLPGYEGEVWYNPDGIANILSLSDVKKHYQVTYNSADGGCFRVHKPDGMIREFKESKTGLYFMLATNAKQMELGTTLAGSGSITTVDDQKSKYTVRSYSRAVKARKFQDLISRPPLRKLLEIIDKNLIADCPITREDVMVAEDIFGTNLGSLKGKTPHRPPIPVNNWVTAVPPAIMARCQEIVWRPRVRGSQE